VQTVDLILAFFMASSNTEALTGEQYHFLVG